MRILWIGPWQSDVLCQQVRGSMAKALHEAGNEVSTIVIGETGSWKTGGYDHVVYCPKPRHTFGKIMNQVRFALIASRYQGDTIVLGEKAAHLAPWLSAVRRIRRRRWQLVLDIRTLPIPMASGVLARAFARSFALRMGVAFRHVDAWMAITPRLRRAVESRVNTRDLPCLIWESAVDQGFLDQTDTVPAATISGCGHPVNVLYLGSLSRGRQMDLPIRAMAEFRQQLGPVGLHIVGSGDHVPALHRLIAELNVGDCVHLWPPVPYDQVGGVIRACDIGILPLADCDAWNTSSALKIYEYMGCGRPVLVSDIPAHRDVLYEQPFAFFMPEYSPRGFADALLRFTAIAPDARRRLGQAAREFVRNGHTWNHRARSITGFLATRHPRTEPCDRAFRPGGEP